jgi:hypothetical protein
VLVMTILTTDSQLHELATIDDAARDSTEYVRVPRVALRNIVRDHTTMWTALKERKLLQITPTEDQRSLL